ncbi:unannotated protein [freshwater metagenome]|uniref:Unannotated protein n=1 Tax=freshwater metagenome TaxID=449393 RepID=A0A6J7HHJ3_9ZZZZ|nr:hypothetical protein [Actinomycetota bacterium]
MAERKIDVTAPDVGAYLYRVLREEAGGEGFGVELAFLEDLIADLGNGAELGETDEVRERAKEAIAAAEQLVRALEAVNAAP